MAKKRKYYYADDGGEVSDDQETDDSSSSSDSSPDASEDDSEADSKEEPTGSDSDAEVADNSDKESDSDFDEFTKSAQDSAPSAPSPTGLDPDKVKAAQDYIAAKYAGAGANNDVQAALAQQRKLNNVSNFGEALETLARSNSMAHGGQGVDESFWKGMKDKGNLGVQQALGMKQQNIQNFAMQNQMNREAVQDLMAQGKFSSDQAQAKIAADNQDPNSAISKRKIAGMQAIYASVPGMKEIPWDSFSGADADDIAKSADVVARLKETALQKQMAMQFQQDRINQQHEQVSQQNAVKDQQALGKDLDSQSASIRTGLGQAQTKVNSATRLMQFVDTTPEEIAAAKKDPQARAALIAKMDKMNPQQYSEVVSGLMSQISNGAGSFGQLESLKAPTASQTMANLQQYFSKNPQPAGMGSFIVNNLMTLKNEQDVSQGILDQHKQQMIAKHPEAFKHPSTADSSMAMLDKFTEAPQLASTGQQGPPPAYAHAQADQAKAWALANPNDPRSTEILKRLGTMNASNNQ